MYRTLLSAVALASGLYAGTARATLITLNAGTVATLRSAVAQANADHDATHSYLISVAPGTYVDPNLHVSRSMTIDAVVDGSVTLLGTADLPNQKGLILSDGIGTKLSVDGLVFQGAHISNSLGGNGAGIRSQVKGSGSGLTITDSRFLNNQEGILTGGSGGLDTVLIQRSVFRGNGNASTNNGQEHAAYIGDAASFTLTDSTFCGTVGQGHNIKSRALRTLMSGIQSWEGLSGGGCTSAGNASRSIDLPNGGLVRLFNVDLFQGAASPNSAMLEYGAEGLKFAQNRMSLTNVDFVSTSGGTGIQWFGGANPCLLTGVTFTGVTTQQSPSGCSVSGGPTPGLLATVQANQASVAIPEPSTLALLGGALLGFVVTWISARSPGLQAGEG